MTPADRDLLVRIDERTAELWRVVVKGNGTPGLVERTTALESAYKTLRSNVRLIIGIVMAIVGSGGLYRLFAAITSR